MKVVQVRVRVKNDGLTWEQRIPVAEFLVESVETDPGVKSWLHVMNGMPLVEKALEIGRAYAGAEEIRWNWKADLQGHYHTVTVE